MLLVTVFTFEAVSAFPERDPENVVATSFPAVVSRYTPVSFMRVPVDVALLVDATRYAFVVVATVLFTFSSVLDFFSSSRYISSMSD